MNEPTRVGPDRRPSLLSVVSAGNPLPRGMTAISMGLLIQGVTTYAFLAIANRSLDADAYAIFAVFWGLLFVLGPSLFQPLEQEVTRATSERAASGQGSAPVFWRSAVVGGVVWLGACALLPVAWLLGLDGLLDNEISMLVALGAALGGWALSQLVRGVLAGRSLFGPYAATLGAEGAIRVAAILALIAFGWTTSGSLGLVVASSFAASALLVAVVRSPIVRPGPPTSWQEITPRIGWLLVASMSEATLLNIGPVIVGVLSDVAADPGYFLNALVVSRIPVFLFQGVKASLLPALTTHATNRDHLAFRRDLQKMVLVLGAGTAFFALLFGLFGPAIVDLLFATPIDGREMALLSAGNSISMMAVSFALGLVALGRPRRAAGGWAAGVAVFAGTLLVPGSVFFRIGAALLTSMVAIVAILAWSTRQEMRSPRRAGS